MSSRRHGSPPQGSRSAQAPGMMRHVYLERVDTKPVAQPSELERLAIDNQRLATTHVALRQELVATTQDIQKLKAHIGTIQAESDAQIRLLLDKISKMEVDIQAGDTVKKEVQKAHAEARALVVTRQDLIAQIEKSSQELKKVRAEVEALPELKVELDGLKQEHQKLRLIFEHEKKLNMEKAAQLESTDKDLLGMAREIERLRADMFNTEKRANAPNMYGGPHMNQEWYPPPPMHDIGGNYVDGYGNYHHASYDGGDPRLAGGLGGRPQWGPPPPAPPPHMPPYGVGHPGPQWRGPLPYNSRA
ncbi:protein FLX-like 4 [Bidens hawaiensis]|uniref:protein FLX-like 4 n=1 Tax=Bidens hawaiensis TaxID=980011 RepID=UPI004049799E